MGSWGHGPFDNDAAGDLLAEAGDASSPARLLRRALEVAARAKASAYLEIDEGGAALAACELVAVAMGHGAADSLQHGAVGAIVDRFTASPAHVEVALTALARVTRPRGSELMELAATGPEAAAFVAMLADLRRRLQAARAGKRLVAQARAGDVLALPVAAGASAVFVLVVVSAREVAVFDGACADAGSAARHAATRPARRVALAGSATALLAAGQVVATGPVRADLRGKQRYASEVGRLGLDYSLTSAAYGDIEAVGYEVARTHDLLDPMTLDRLRDLAVNAPAPRRVRSPAEREAAYVAPHRAGWKVRRARTTPHAFGDAEVVASLLAWMAEYGVANAVDVHARIAAGTQGYGRPCEDPERQAYAFCGLVAYWRSGWGKRELPAALAAQAPPAPPARLRQRAVEAARTLAAQVITPDAELRLIWALGADRGAGLRRAVASLQRALAA
ncbi:MAG: DUF4259 domain-containing protein [Kofleriaceae bacterium]|nr:DUF4259 domain-containing protein [Kofleriaceae bacterium]